MPFAKKMKILGIDPGLGITGYGVVEPLDGGFKLIEAGVIKTALKEGISRRLFSIHEELSNLISDFKPELCVLEDLYSHYKHRMTAVLMAHARGAILLACEQKSVPVKSYSAKRVKLAVVGNGNASKAQVQRMVQNILALSSAPSPEDVSDALALALAYLYTERMRPVRL